MSITNFINEQDVTIIQGVNGIRLCEESWITGRTRTSDKPAKETKLREQKPEVKQTRS